MKRIFMLQREGCISGDIVRRESSRRFCRARGELPLTLSTTTLNPRTRENTAFLPRARYFRQRILGDVCLFTTPFSSDFKESTKGTRAAHSNDVSNLS